LPEVGMQANMFHNGEYRTVSYSIWKL